MHAAIIPNWKLSMAYALAGDGEIPEALRLLGEYSRKVPDGPCNGIAGKAAESAAVR
jgi:hypothetical protein